MSLKIFNRLRFLLMVLVSLGMFIGIYTNIIFISVMSVGFGMVIITFLKTQLKDMVEDERLQDVHEKAARTSFAVLMPILGLTSLTLFFTGEGPFYFLKGLGVIIGYITCFGLLIYLVSYFLLNRKYGG